ncbi:SCO1664 family protein [Nocardioides panacisoli]|uniref:SCO1664 family protein n=1 Tax=Nocardioides panacisoli TaxID=627624 RepID=UPI001C628D8B|nr:SCO1664 family protein [Nocardioides panacisoli]QYJ05037.1 SCO1664 family protein [Nocardioides panacisoli]
MTGELALRGRIMPASNATFLAELDGREVVYKPVAGEKPLWDFPDRTLADREVAAYLLSEATGWGLVPPTWHGVGPHGPGMVQEWQEVDESATAVDLVPAGRAPAGWLPVFDGLDEHDREVTLVHEDTPSLRRLAVFDVLCNNADRKGGHVLVLPDGTRLGIDHGVTFHHETKLRTVLWGWAGAPLAAAEVGVVEEVLEQLAGPLGEDLAELLTDLELDALTRRGERLLAAGHLPGPEGGWPPIPWPPF